MPYRVIRTVNGKHYAYLQECRRDPNTGKPVTRTVEYLGPVDPVYDTSKQGKRVGGQGQTVAEVTKTSTRVKTTTALAQDTQTKTASVPSPIPRKSITTSRPSSSAALHRAFARAGCVLKPKPTASTVSLIHSKANLGSRRISRQRLDEESRQFVAILESKGIDPGCVGRIRFRWGEKISQRAARFGNDRIISTPNKVAPAALQAEIAKAHARIALDALRKTHPDAYADLSLQASASFKTSQSLLSSALQSGRDWRKVWKTIGLKYFGNHQNLQRSFQNPEHWGFYDYDRKATWEDEAVSMYAQAVKHGGLYGFAKALKTEQQRAGAVEAQLEECLADTPRFKRKSVQRDLQRARLRSEILRQNSSKLATLNALFFANYAFFPHAQSAPPHG